MCATCGCETLPHEHDDIHAHDQAHDHDHGHDHDHDDHHHAHPHVHDHPHPHSPANDDGGRTVRLEMDILAKNDALARDNRAVFAVRRLAVFNLTSAPGSGKTSLLESLIVRLRERIRLAVIEGDQETARDADRVRAAGAAVVQINTRTGCHLDAGMVRGAVADLNPADGSLLLIENVGNLVCPALFDLGERTKIVLMSVTEGEDKPLKYPHMFRAAGVVVLSKIDLLPHLDFDLAQCLANLARVNPALRIFQLSAKTGTGMAPFCDWLVSQVASARA
jgi:hydrogenase nickel incorporation protein HypB